MNKTKKNRLFIKVILFFAFIGIMIGIERISHWMTDDFGLTSIFSKTSYHQDWEITNLNTDQIAIKEALLQEYHYLTSGSQSYVFISNDKKYIIKFFKQKRWRLNSFYLYISHPLSWHKKRKDWQSKRREIMNDTFKSSKISYELFKEETGLLFVHLNKTKNLQTTLIVKDKIGFKHKLVLDDLQFVLQKKAIPTHEYLLSLRNAKDLQGAKKAIFDMLTFTKNRAKLGYSDKDPHFIRNFGFINGKSIQIDIGGFHKDQRKDFQYYQSRELLKIKNKLLPWIQENYPELIAYTEEQIDFFSH